LITKLFDKAKKNKADEFYTQLPDIEAEMRHYKEQFKGKEYIIQGQTACSRDKHPKPSSLDCWLRDKYAKNPDTKQAVNAVIENLLKTGEFETGEFTCPDSGRKCKGIRVL